MKFCDKCKVNVDTTAKRCPLCSMTLMDTNEHFSGRLDLTAAMSGDADGGSNYPETDEGFSARYNLLFRLFLFISIVIGSTAILINLLTYSGLLWSLYVIGSILYVWITVGYPLIKKRKIGHIIVVNSLSTAVYLYSIELATRTKGWGLTYVTPFIFITATLAITFIIILRRLKWREYSTYQIAMIILGFIPIIFCIAGLVRPIWPSVLSAFYSLLTLIGMFVFTDKKYKDELVKRFHL